MSHGSKQDVLRLAPLVVEDERGGGRTAQNVTQLYILAFIDQALNITNVTNIRELMALKKRRLKSWCRY